MKGATLRVKCAFVSRHDEFAGLAGAVYAPTPHRTVSRFREVELDGVVKADFW